MVKLLFVLFGGAVGTGIRFGLNHLVNSMLVHPQKYPYATFFINLTGSLMIGLLAELFDTRVVVSPELRVALLVGVLGGYTTFSSYSLETLVLIRDGRWEVAMFYSLGSVAFGLLAVWAGTQLARLF